MEKIGHRGAAGYAPENTLMSFNKALELGADLVEGDVWLTKDQEVIFMHDATVNRTTTGRGRISRLTLAQIKKYKTKISQQEIPTLEEVLQSLRHRGKINLEIKTQAALKRVLEKIQQLDFPTSDVIVSSNSLPALRLAKKILPAITTAWIFSVKAGPLNQAIWYIFSQVFFLLIKYYLVYRLTKNQIARLHLYYLLVSPQLIDFLHHHNIKIFAWTVNHPGLIKKFAYWGIDGIFSDYPDRLVN